MIAIEATGEGPSILGHIGSVEDVIAARLPEEMTSRRYQADDFAAGFELATPKTLASMGEAVIAGGYCFTNSTDASSKDYDTTIFGKEFTSGGMFLIPREAKPSHLFQVDEKMSMIDLYQTLYAKIQHPLVFFGIFHFAAFHGTAIGKPPVNGHQIFTHKEEYYPNPDVFRKDVWGFVMGALTNFEGFPKINEQLKTVLYKNPMDAPAALVHHAHVLLLKKRVERTDEIVPEIVDRTLHLFIEGSSIVSGQGEVFLAGEVQDFLLKGRKVYEGR